MLLNPFFARQRTVVFCDAPGPDRAFLYAHFTGKAAPKNAVAPRPCADKSEGATTVTPSDFAISKLRPDFTLHVIRRR